VVTLALVYLELPLRAGPFRAALVYGRPDTWDGFWYVALGQQFVGSLAGPEGGLAGALGSLVDRTVGAFGILTPLLPVAFVATALQRPAYAVLTGTAVGLTCLFAGVYLNAEIGRYYLGPVLIAWTWLAILAGTAAGAVSGWLARTPGDRPSGAGWPARVVAPLLVVALALPTIVDLPARFSAVDESHDRDAAGWVAHALAVMEPGAVIVSWWSYSTPLWYAQRVEGRRADLQIVDDRTRLDENLGGITDVIDAHLGREPVYVIRDDEREIERLAERYVLQFIDGPSARWLTRVVRLREDGA
jgi:hypothetical protein